MLKLYFFIYFHDKVARLTIPGICIGFGTVVKTRQNNDTNLKRLETKKASE